MEVVLKISTVSADEGGYTELQALHSAIAGNVIDRTTLMDNYENSEDSAGDILFALINDSDTVAAFFEKLSEAEINKLQTAKEISVSISTEGPEDGGNSEFDIVFYVVTDSFKKLTLQVKGYNDSGQIMERELYDEVVSEQKALKSLSAKLISVLDEMILA